MKKIVYIAAIFIFGILIPSCEKKQQLQIYSVLHDEETTALCERFTQKTGIPAVFLRASTGELVNRIISEKNNPNADILLGGASSYHILADEAGALAQYVSPEAKGFPQFALSSSGTWTGICLITLGIGINQKRFEEKFPSEKIPATWEDLLNPAFKGEIVMTNPVASSTAYLFVQNQLQRLGDDAGWAYLEALSKNVGQFPDSGSAPAKLIGTGEYAIGIAYLNAIAKYNAQGFDLISVSPPKSAGDIDCIAITKNTKNLENAKKFVDFMLSAEAQELMSSINFTIPVNPNAKSVEGAASIDKVDLMELDTKKASETRDAVLEKWSSVVK